MSTSLSGRQGLETRIQELEKQYARQMTELKASGADIGDSLSPSRMLKSALKEVSQSPDLRKTAINTAIGIGAGFLGKKLYIGNSKSMFKKVAGSAVQFLIANFVRKKIPDMHKNGLENGHEQYNNG